MLQALLTNPKKNYQMEKELELMERNRLKCIDRHELEKILDRSNIPFYNYESDDCLREKVWNYCELWDEGLALE